MSTVACAGLFYGGRGNEFKKKFTLIESFRSVRCKAQKIEIFFLMKTIF